jgi:hypothetical protein
MKSVWFFIGLLITATIIFLSLTRTTLKVEYFTDSLPINSLATELGISPSRIRNFKEIGDINNPSQYSISFEIHPRNIMMKSDPLLSDIEKKIKDMISTNKTFDIKSSTDQDVFLSKITMNYVEPTNVTTEEKQQKYVKFVNPEFNGAISYLKDVQQGLPDDPFLDPRYKFEKGKIVLNEIPTPSPSLSANNQTTRTPSSSTSRTSTGTTTRTYDEQGGEDEDGGEGDEGVDDEGEGEPEDEGEGGDEGEGATPGANDTEPFIGFNPNDMPYQFF